MKHVVGISLIALLLLVIVIAVVVYSHPPV